MNTTTGLVLFFAVCLALGGWYMVIDAVLDRIAHWLETGGGEDWD